MALYVGRYCVLVYILDRCVALYVGRYCVLVYILDRDTAERETSL